MSLTLEQVKSKSSARLKGLHPVVLAATTALIERCYARGVPIIITQGLRTIAEQDALYAQGRTKSGSVVTNAKGGTSYHNYGLAIDFALLLPDGKQVSWDLKRDGDGDKVADWTEVVREAKSLGFEWGGDFVSIKDAPHLQMTFGLTTTQLRAGAKPDETKMAIVKAKIERYMKECEDVKVDKANTVVNGEKLKEGSVLIEGRTYVPLAAIGKALGANVSFDNETKTATITTIK
ncbi:M15 family metallopeptidase [Paenibacillus sp. FSL L8-0323]|uniref:M15 family metallopeptidase n=1 Tax=Paenibacillus sp. FSL L8-0323 TaxID=2975330 RepID=UPI0030F56C27